MNSQSAREPPRVEWSRSPGSWLEGWGGCSRSKNNIAPSDQALHETPEWVNPAGYVQYHPYPAFTLQCPSRLANSKPMGRGVRFPPAAPGPGHRVRHVPSLAGAVEAFFANRDLAFATCRTYRQALDPLVEALGGDRPVTDLDTRLVAALFADRCSGCAPATWNTRRVAVQAFASWCGDQWPLTCDLLAGVPPRRRRSDNTRAIPFEDLEELWRRRTVLLREKALWRMLYETVARASEVLALDVEDLDRRRRRARIRSKGGSVDMIVWAAPTARLLGRYLTDRTTGPLFLTRWKSRTAPPRRDLYGPTGQARLSYRTTAAEFRKHSGDWTLHQLRHSSLTHLAEAGASAVMLQAKSRHRDLRTLSVSHGPG